MIYYLIGFAFLIVTFYFCVSYYYGRQFYHVKTGSIMKTPSYFPFKTFIALSNFATGFQKLFEGIPEKVIRLNIFGTNNWVVCADASEARRILLSKDKFSRVKQLVERLKDIMPLSGIGTPVETEWRRQRKHLVTGFDMNHLEKLIPIFQDYTQIFMKMIDKNQAEGKQFEADVQFGFLTTDIIGKSAFGFDFQATATNGKSDFVKYVSDLTNNTSTALALLPGFFYTPAGKKMLSSLQSINKVCYEVISARRKEIEENPDVHYNDLLDLMLAKDTEGNPILNDLQVRDNAFFFLIAGSETTSILISNLLYLLCKNKTKQEKLQQEIDMTMDSLSGPLTIHKLNEMVYLQACLKEALRIYPAASFTSREAREDDVIGGYRIPAKTMVLIPIRYIQTDTEIFGADALEFKPERWLDDHYVSTVQHAYFPFGGGIFDCIGKNMALLEAKVVLSLLLHNYSVELKDPNYTIRFKKHKLLKPDGLFLKFNKK